MSMEVSYPLNSSINGLLPHCLSLHALRPRLRPAHGTPGEHAYNPSSHTTHPSQFCPAVGFICIVIVMDLMGLSAEVLRLYLNQANLTTISENHSPAQGSATRAALAAPNRGPVPTSGVIGKDIPYPRALLAAAVPTTPVHQQTLPSVACTATQHQAW